MKNKLQNRIFWGRLAIWLLIGFYLVLALSFVTVERSSLVCNKMNIRIRDSIINRFITRYDVATLLDQQGVKVLGYPLNRINTLYIEQLIRELPPVESVEAYSTADGVLNIDIIQRRPVIRIINRIGQSYYIDSQGRLMTLSPRFTSHVPVATGYINDRLSVINGASVLDTTLSCNQQISRLFALGQYIAADDFFRSQIQQLYVHADGEVEMLPRIGNHVILFGSMDNYSYKFKKLKSFYSAALNTTGWTQYKKIDVRFSNQVVCTKN